MQRSRLSKRAEEKNKRNLIVSVIGIVIIIILAFKFGVPFLINFSVFLTKQEGNEVASKNDPSFIAPPVFDSFPQATSSASIVISGIASKNQTINLYINDKLVDKTKTNNDGKFSFKESITSGEKVIKAKAVVDEKESEFSQPIVTSLKNSAPSLNIISPADGQSFSKDQGDIDVQGTTDSDVRITVNDFWAITDGQGNFSYNLPLKPGDNKINIQATDLAGNKTEKTISVTYSP